MQLLCQYPIAAEHVMPYVGRAVAAITPEGDVVCGIVQCIHDGNVVLRPVDNVPEAAIAGITKTLERHPRTGELKAKLREKARVKAWGYGPYSYGWGYGSYGWGAGWWWIWPLFALAALAAFPFFW